MQQLVLDLSFSTSYHPADFAMSECNREALLYVKGWREWPSYGVFIIGAKDSGKTHLCSVYHAERPTALSLSPDSLKKKNVFDIEASHIIIDDADQVRDETAFFHLINMIKQRKGSLFLTAKTAPSEWKMRLPDLQSRLCSLPVVRLSNADIGLLYDILLKLFSDRQILIDDETARYIFKYIHSDIKTIRECVEYIDEAISLEKKPLSRLLFRNILFAHTDMMNETAKEKFLGIK